MTQTLRSAGKVAFVTGAGSGIGRASALRLARDGARVAVAELDPARGAQTVASLSAAGADALHVVTDVTDEASVVAALDATMERFGRIDVLVNCAGGSVAADRPVTDVDLDVFDATIALDLKGPFLCARHGIRHLAAGGGGSIINFTSVVALKGAFAGHAYTAAKGGVISLTRALAGRYWRQGIRVNAIAPGIVLSERVARRQGIDTALPPAEQLAASMSPDNHLVDQRHPFGYGMPEDIAHIVAFLASDESRMINAAVIPAEGGASSY